MTKVRKNTSDTWVGCLHPGWQGRFHGVKPMKMSKDVPGQNGKETKMRGEKTGAKAQSLKKHGMMLKLKYSQKFLCNEHEKYKSM